MNPAESFYRIADLDVSIQGDKAVSSASNMRGLKPFHILKPSHTPDLSYQAIYHLDMPDCPPITSFDAENSHCSFYIKDNGNLFFRMEATNGDLHFFETFPGQSIVKATETDNMFLLRFSLWMSISLFVYHRQRIPMHASAIEYKGQCVLFLGPSGTGKSTHSELWLQNIPGCSLLNDDAPILFADDKCALVYGSPWSGKTPCYNNRCTPLKAIVRLHQAPHNHIRKLSVVESLSCLIPIIPSVYTLFHDTKELCFDTLAKALNFASVYDMECLPDKDAAITSFNTIFGE